MLKQIFRKMMSVFMVSGILLTSATGVLAQEKKVLRYNGEASLSKSWNVKFSKAFDEETINEEAISLIDDNGIELPFSISIKDSKNIEITPRFNYKPGEVYSLVLEDKITDIKGDELAKPVVFQFKTESTNFKDMEEVIGWELGTYEESYDYILDDKRNIVNEKSDKNILKSISPSVFFPKYENGKMIGIKSIVNEEYIKTAKDNGYEIIPMVHVIKRDTVHSSVKQYQEAMKSFFEDEELEKRWIKKLSEELNNLEVDRVILDFEGLGEINKENYTEFIKNMKNQMEDIDLMVCVAYPSENYYFNFLDIKGISGYVSDFMFMAYDQRDYRSGTPGSIASNAWVENGVKKLLELGVENEKLILSSPLYTVDYATVDVKGEYDSVFVKNRVQGGEVAALYTNSDGSGKIKEVTYGDTFTTLDSNKNFWKVGFEGGEGWINRKFVQWIGKGSSIVAAVGGTTVTQRQLDKIKDENKGFSIEYNYEQGQNILVYNKMDKGNTKMLKRMVWLEDKTALQVKGELIQKYKLKGIAFWKLGNESPHFFDK